MILFRRGEATSSRRGFCAVPLCQFSALLVIALFAAQSIAQTSDTDDAQSEVIRGTVVNAVTHAGIPRALVSSADNRYAMLTDADGHFEFTVPRTSEATTGFAYSGPPPALFVSGQHHAPLPLMARKPGFLEPPERIGGVQAASDNEITIPLLPEGIIKGRVTAAGDEAAQGIMVQVLTRQVEDGLPRWVAGQTTQATSTGEFRFAELLPGSYKIVTREWMDNDPVASVPGSQVYGYPPVYYPGVGEPATAGSVEVGAGQTVETDVQIVRQPYHQVRIPVANTDAVNGFSVLVQGQQGARFELGYNPSEQRIEGMLPSGNYVVQATTYGPNSMSGSVAIRVADGPTQGPALSLTPNTSIPINVKEEFTNSTAESAGTRCEGNRCSPLTGPRLYLQVRVESADEMEPRGGSLRPPTTPGDPTLALEALPPGRYWLRVSSGRGYVASATMGSIDLLHDPFTVGPGSSAPIEITMRDDGAELEGTVSSLAGQSAASASGPSAWVYCIPLPESAGEFQQLPLSDEGKFDVQTMPPGDYRILAFSAPQSNLPYRDPEAMKEYESKGQVVHLSPGQKTTVQLQSILTPEQP